METTSLDALRLAYKQATDEWALAIRAEEILATSDHSVVAWENWDTDGFAEEDAQSRAKAARDAYKDALREANLGF